MQDRIKFQGAYHVVIQIPADTHRLWTGPLVSGHCFQKFIQGCPVSPPVAQSESGEPTGQTAPELDHCEMGVTPGLAADPDCLWNCGGSQWHGRRQSEPGFGYEIGRAHV